MRVIIKSIASFISKTNQYNEDEEEKVEYALRILIFEVLKIIGTIFIFSLIGYPLQASVAIFTMTMSKPYIGGYHEDTQIKCFIATIIIVAGVLYLSTNLSLDLISILILNIVSLYSIWHQAPVINPRMNLTKPELIKRNRILGVSFSGILMIISIGLYKYAAISSTIVWTMTFQVLLMFNKRN